MRPIDADELLGIEKILSTGVRSTEARVLMEQVIFDIQQSPAINPEDLRPKGKWEDRPTGRYGQWQTWCTNCGQHNGIGGTEKNRHKPFCPNCGAKMEE